MSITDQYCVTAGLDIRGGLLLAGLGAARLHPGGLPLLSLQVKASFCSTNFAVTSLQTVETGPGRGRGGAAGQRRGGGEISAFPQSFRLSHHLCLLQSEQSFKSNLVI